MPFLNRAGRLLFPDRYRQELAQGLKSKPASFDRCQHVQRLRRRWEFRIFFDHLPAWVGGAGDGHWPDADMLPFGCWCRTQVGRSPGIPLEPDEARTQLTLPERRKTFGRRGRYVPYGGTSRMGDDPGTRVVNADGRTWDIPNLWVCDGSVFPAVGGVNPSLTIQAIACRTADRIRYLAQRDELG